jgi:hypothetical protein
MSARTLLRRLSLSLGRQPARAMAVVVLACACVFVVAKLLLVKERFGRQKMDWASFQKEGQLGFLRDRCFKGQSTTAAMKSLNLPKNEMPAYVKLCMDVRKDGKRAQDDLNQYAQDTLPYGKANRGMKVNGDANCDYYTKSFAKSGEWRCQASYPVPTGAKTGKFEKAQCAYSTKCAQQLKFCDDNPAHPSCEILVADNVRQNTDLDSLQYQLKKYTLETLDTPQKRDERSRSWDEASRSRTRPKSPPVFRPGANPSGGKRPPPRPRQRQPGPRG